MSTRLFFTRRWTPNDILAIGYELATLSADAVTQFFARQDVPKKHMLVFLFIVDACLKRQTASTRSACCSALSRFIKQAGCSIDDAMGYEVHSLCVHWVETGLVPATAVFSFDKTVFASWSTHACEHDSCGARFVSRKHRDVHMDVHFHERVALLNVSEVSAAVSASTWVMDDTGVPHAVRAQGYFHTRREAVETLRLRGVRRRQGSPLPCRRVAALCTTCDVCGDVLPDKRFDDALREWVYDDCVLYVAWARHAPCHAEV